MGKYNFAIDPSVRNGHTVVANLVGEKKMVLEVGCATGYMTKYMTESMECTVDCLEVDSEALAVAAEYANIAINADVQKFNFTSLGPAYDAVVFADVLEHLVDPLSVLKSCRNCLKPDGRIVASIPNISHLSVLFELSYGEFNYRPLGLLDNTHVHFFTRSSIERLFDEAGYDILQIDTIKVEPQDTEFNAIPDEQLQQIIKVRNEDWDTYQFAINARVRHEPIESNDFGIEERVVIGTSNEVIKCESEKVELRKQAAELRDLNNKLEVVIHSHSKALSKLSSDIAVLERENLYLENENDFLRAKKGELERDLNWLRTRFIVRARLFFGRQVKRILKVAMGRH